MLTSLLPFPWNYIASGLAVLALVAGCWFAWDHYIRDPYVQQGRDEIQTKWDAQRAADRAFTSSVIVDLSNKLMEAKDDAQRERTAHDRTFDTVASIIGSVHSGSGIRLPADVARVLDASSAAANADTAAVAAVVSGGKEGAPAVSQPAEAPLVYDEREFAQYLNDGAQAYDDARGLWKACRAREDVMRARFNKLIGGAT